VEKNLTKHRLGDDEHGTGVADGLSDPRNPNVVYAATWQKTFEPVAAYFCVGKKGRSP